MHRRAPVIAALVAAPWLAACAKEPTAPTTTTPAPTATAAAPTATAAPSAPPAPTATAAPSAPGHGATVEQTPPRTLDQLPDGRLALGPFSVAPPAGWTTRTVTSRMRAAAFVAPGKPGADAELTVYYFGASGAGSVEANLDRWFGQFVQPDGKPSRAVARVEQTKLAGLDATLASVAGRYLAPATPGGTDLIDKPDQALLGAIVASPVGPYYWKLIGPRATVDAQATAFRAMLGSLKVR